MCRCAKRSFICKIQAFLQLYPRYMAVLIFYRLTRHTLSGQISMKLSGSTLPLNPSDIYIKNSIRLQQPAISHMFWLLLDPLFLTLLLFSYLYIRIPAVKILSVLYRYLDNEFLMKSSKLLLVPMVL